jgi:predicted DNA-binding protein with PD1-like motif
MCGRSPWHAACGGERDADAPDLGTAPAPRAIFVQPEEATVRSKLLRRDGGATYALIFETGDEVISGLTAFAQEHDLEASDFTALGAFSRALLGFFEVDRKEYRKIPIAEQVEVLSLVGNITRDAGAAKVHAHAVLGCADGATRGGHLLEGEVRPTLEVILTESPAALRRRFDEASGLALIRL